MRRKTRFRVSALSGGKQSSLGPYKQAKDQSTMTVQEKMILKCNCQLKKASSELEGHDKHISDDDNQQGDNGIQFINICEKTSGSLGDQRSQKKDVVELNGSRLTMGTETKRQQIQQVVKDPHSTSQDNLPDQVVKISTFNKSDHNRAAAAAGLANEIEVMMSQGGKEVQREDRLKITGVLEYSSLDIPVQAAVQAANEVAKNLVKEVRPKATHSRLQQLETVQGERVARAKKVVKELIGDTFDYDSMYQDLETLQNERKRIDDHPKIRRVQPAHHKSTGKFLRQNREHSLQSCSMHYAAEDEEFVRLLRQDIDYKIAFVSEPALSGSGAKRPRASGSPSREQRNKIFRSSLGKRHAVSSNFDDNAHICPVNQDQTLTMHYGNGWNSEKGASMNSHSIKHRSSMRRNAETFQNRICLEAPSNTMMTTRISSFIESPKRGSNAKKIYQTPAWVDRMTRGRPSHDLSEFQIREPSGELKIQTSVRRRSVRPPGSIFRSGVPIHWTSSNITKSVGIHRMDKHDMSTVGKKPVSKEKVLKQVLFHSIKFPTVGIGSSSSIFGRNKVISGSHMHVPPYAGPLTSQLGIGKHSNLGGCSKQINANLNMEHGSNFSIQDEFAEHGVKGEKTCNLDEGSGRITPDLLRLSMQHNTNHETEDTSKTWLGQPTDIEARDTLSEIGNPYRSDTVSQLEKETLQGALLLMALQSLLQEQPDKVTRKIHQHDGSLKTKNPECKVETHDIATTSLYGQGKTEVAHDNVPIFKETSQKDSLGMVDRVFIETEEKAEQTDALGEATQSLFPKPLAKIDAAVMVDRVSLEMEERYEQTDANSEQDLKEGAAIISISKTCFPKRTSRANSKWIKLKDVETMWSTIGKFTVTDTQSSLEKSSTLSEEDMQISELNRKALVLLSKSSVETSESSMSSSSESSTQEYQIGLIGTGSPFKSKKMQDPSFDDGGTKFSPKSEGEIKMNQRTSMERGEVHEASNLAMPKEKLQVTNSENHIQEPGEVLLNDGLWSAIALRSRSHSLISQNEKLWNSSSGEISPGNLIMANDLGEVM